MRNKFIDTHCHIHDLEFFSPEEAEDAYNRAIASGVEQMICVGTDFASSKQAVQFAKLHEGVFAAIGIHPHEAKKELANINEFIAWCKSVADDKKVIAIGEMGLDYFYNHSPVDEQKKLLELQLDMALELDLPISFHVREAYEDFFTILNKCKLVRGVLHSFTDELKWAKKAINQGLFIGVNGISTFTKDKKQIEMYDSLPLESIVLETDAPFLTPVPFRGKINEPKHVRQVGACHAKRRGVDLASVASATTQNAKKLFKF